MKAHVQNPWTRSPSLMVNMSVEEAQQLREALSWVQTGDLTANQASALEDLARTLEHALQTERPHGIKGAEP